MDIETKLPIFSSKVEDTQELHHYIFSSIESYLDGRTLLSGDDLPFMLSILLAKQFCVHLNADSELSREMLYQKYLGNRLVRTVHMIDFLSPYFVHYYSHLFGAFSNLILLNSIVTSSLNTQFLKNAATLLTTNGILILTMPSLTATFELGQLNLQECKQFDYKPLKTFLSGYYPLKTRYYYTAPNNLYIIVIAEKVTQ